MCTFVALVTAFMTLSATVAHAAPAVGLGTSGAFALLAGQGVTNTGPSVISGNVGTDPGGVGDRLSAWRHHRTA